MISYYGLIELGFSPEEFELQDDSLGEGVFIKKWNSNKPIPSTSSIEQAEQEYIIQEIEKQEKLESLKAGAMRKLVENAGLTVAEVQSFINLYAPAEEEEE
jgi:hypothetical protein